MITLHGTEVVVIAADLSLREATVRWSAGKVRVVPILSLKGSKGGDLEVVAVCREAEKRARVIDEGVEVARRIRGPRLA